MVGAASAMPAVKICGLCRPADAADAVRLGASYLGVILSARGPRALAVDAAAEVLARRGAARAVGVFVDEPVARVAQLAGVLALDVVQLHGDEDVAAAAALRDATGAVVWKALRVRDPATVTDVVARYAGAVDGILLDGFRAGAAGGAGEAFDWAAAAGVRAALPAGVRLVVAGGLTPENVGAAIAALGPDVVDVSSGVEAEPCRKSAARMGAFIERVRGPAGRLQA